MQYVFHYPKYFTFLKNLNSNSLNLKWIQMLIFILSAFFFFPIADFYDLKSDSLCWYVHRTCSFHIYLTNCTALGNNGMSIVQVWHPSSCVCLCVCVCVRRCLYGWGTCAESGSRIQEQLLAALCVHGQFLGDLYWLGSRGLYCLCWASPNAPGLGQLQTIPRHCLEDWYSTWATTAGTILTIWWYGWC